MVAAGRMPDGPDNTVLLDGDAADADGVGITVEPEAETLPTSPATARWPCCPSGRPDGAPHRGRRLRRGRAHRRLRRLPHRRRHALRGGRPARRPRRHPRRRRRASRTLRDRHRLHRAQPAHLPGAAAAVRRARRRHPASPRCRCRSATTAPGWSGRARSGAAGLFPTSANLRKPRYLAMLAEIPRFHRQARRLLDTEPTTATLQRVPRRRPLLGVLRAALHGAARRRGLVVRPGGRARLPRPLPVHLPRAPRHARRLRLAAVAHRRRRLARVRRAGSPRPSPTSGSAPRSPRCSRSPPASRSPTATAHVELYDARRGRHPPRPGARDARRPDDPAARRARRDALLPQPGPAPHRHLGAVPRPSGARASWNFRRPATTAAWSSPTTSPGSSGSTPTSATSSPSGGAAEHLVDPAKVLDRMEYEHPLYNPTSVAAQAKLSRIDTDRLAFAGAYHGWGFHEDGARSGLAAAERLGLTWGEPATASVEAGPDLGVYETTISHTRRRPWKRRFTLRSHTWLVDVDDLPDHGVLGRFEARDHLGDPERSIRENVVGVPARARGRGRPRPDPDGRPAARARLLLQPDLGVLVPRRRPGPRWPPWSRCTTPTATGTPTSCTPTSRAAPARPRRCTSRRSTAPTAPTTSRCPCRPAAGSRSPSPCAPTTAPASAPRCAAGRADVSPRRAAPAALRGSAAHPAPRHLAVAAPAPRPTPPRHHQEGV